MLKKLALGLMLISVAACSDSDSKPGGDPAGTIGNELRGYSYHSDVMMGKERQLHWIQDAVSGYRRSGEDMLPAKVTKLKRSGCSFPRPKDGQAVYAAHVEGGVQSSSIHHFSKRQLAKRAESFVRAYVKYKGKMPSGMTFTAGSAMRTVNAVVTETQKPVFLVLASGSDVVWNIQKAPGAAIDRIVVLSGRMAGLANVPEGTKVHAVYGSGLRRCGVQPARIPEKHWRFVQNVAELGTGADKLAENRKRAGSFGFWLRKNFGISHKAVIGDAELSNVLFGEMPAGDAGLPFKPIGEAHVMLSPADHLLVAPKTDFEQASRNLVREAAVRAAGGDLEKLVAGVN